MPRGPNEVRTSPVRFEAAVMSGEIQAALQADTTDTVRELKDLIARQMGIVDVYNLVDEHGHGVDGARGRNQ